MVRRGRGWDFRTGRHGQLCLVHADRRQALRLRRTAARLRGLTATRVAGRFALVPSMAQSVRRCCSASSGAARLIIGSARKRDNLRQVASNARCSVSDWPWESSGPPSSPMRLRTTCSIGRLRRSLSICNARMSSPPRAQMLSRCRRKVWRDSCRASRLCRNGLKYSTNRRPGGISHASYAQLRGH